MTLQAFQSYQAPHTAVRLDPSLNYALTSHIQYVRQFMLGVLKEWGCTWMWDSLRVFCNDDWIKRCHRKRVPYLRHGWVLHKEMITDLCSAAFILECKDKKGEL